MSSNEQDAYTEWNKGLEEIEPLIDYYARQMGQLSGRLMTALSFLDDLKNSHLWPEQNEQVRETVTYASLLIASVLKMVAAGQAEQGELEREAAAAIQEALDILDQSNPDGFDS
jgi:hypothetical protein